MSELSREQLLDYVRKQKIKIKMLETDLSSKAPAGGPSDSEENESLRSEISALQDDLQRKSATIENLSQRCEAIESEKNKEIERIQQENADNKQKLSKYANLIKTKVKEVEEKDKEISELHEQLSQSQSIPVSCGLEEKVEAQSEEIRTLENTIVGLENAIRAEKEKFVVIFSEAESLRSQVNSLSTENSSKFATLEETLRERGLALAMSTAEVANLKTEADLKSAAFQAQISDLQANLEDMVSKRHEEQTQSSIQLDTLRTQLESLGSTSSTNADHSMQLQSKYDALESDHERIRVDLAKVTAELSHVLSSYFSFEFQDLSETSAYAESIDSLSQLIPLLNAGSLDAKRKEQELLSSVEELTGRLQDSASASHVTEAKLAQEEDRVSALGADTKRLQEKIEADQKAAAQREAINRSLIEKLKSDIAQKSTPAQPAAPIAPAPAPAPSKNKKKGGKNKSGKSDEPTAGAAAVAANAAPTTAGGEEVTASADPADHTPSDDPELGYYRQQVLDLHQTVASLESQIASFGDLPTQLQALRDEAGSHSQAAAAAQLQVSELQQALASAQSELARVSGEYEGAHARVVELQQSLVGAQSEAAAATHAADVARTQVADLQQALQEAQGETAQVNAAVDATRASQAEQSRNQSERILSLETAIAAAETSLAAASQRESESQQLITELRSLLLENSSGASEFTQKISDLEQQLAAAEGRTTQTKELMFAAREEHTQQLAEANAAAEALRQQLADATASSDSASHESLNLSRSIEALKQQLGEAESQQADSRAQFEALSTQLTEAQEQLSSADTEKSNLAARVSSLREQLDGNADASIARTAELSRLLGEAENRTAEESAKLVAAQQGSTRLSQLLADAQAQLDDLSAERAGLVEQIGALRAEKGELSVAKAGLEEVAETLQGEKAVLAAETARLAELAEILQVEKVDLTAALNALREETASLQAQVEAAGQARAASPVESPSDADAASATASASGTADTAAQKALSQKLASKLKSAMNQLERLKAEKGDLLTEKTQFTELIESLQREKSDLTAHAEALSEEKTSLQAQLEAASKSRSTTPSESTDDNATAKSAATGDSAAQIKDLETMNKKLVSKLKITSNQLEKLKSASKVTKLSGDAPVGGGSADASQELSDARAALESLQSEKAGLEAAVSELRQAVRSAEDDAANAREERERQRRRVLELEGELETLQNQPPVSASGGDEERIQSLKQQVKQLTAAAATAAADAVSAAAATASEGGEDSGRISDLESQIAAYKQQVVDAEGEITSLRARLQEAQDSAAWDADDNDSSKISELSAKLTRTKELLQKAREEIEELRCQSQPPVPNQETAQASEVNDVDASAAPAPVATPVAAPMAAESTEGDSPPAQSAEGESEEATAASSCASVSTATAAAAAAAAEEVESLRAQLAQAQEEAAAFSEKAAAAEARVESLSGELEATEAAATRARQQLSERIEQLATALQAAEAAAAASAEELQQKTEYLQVLRTELDETVAAVEKEREIGAGLKETIDTLEQEIEAGRVRTSEKEKEIAEQIRNLDLTNKKLMLKLKNTMKEHNETKASEKKLTQDKEDLEASIKSVRLKLQDALEDASSTREERERHRKRALDFESALESKTLEEKLMRDDYERRCESLRYQTEELTRDGAKAKARIKALEKELEETKQALENSMIALDLAQGSTEAEEQAAALTASLQEANARVAQLTAECDALKKEKKDNEAKVDVMGEKVKRMKVLLTKSKNLAQEREAEVVKLEHSGLRAMKFSIQSRISVTAGPADDVVPSHWCLLYEDDLPAKLSEDDGANAGSMHNLRWVEEHIVRRWLEDGSSLVGSWPDYLQDTWSRQLHSVRSTLEEERNTLKSELDEVTKSFQTYKSRAQIALKRVGYEDRSERQKALQADNEQIAELNGAITDLEACLKESQGSLQEATSMHKIATERVASLEEEVRVLATQKKEELARSETLQQASAELKTQIARLEEIIAIAQSSSASAAASAAKLASDAASSAAASGALTSSKLSASSDVLEYQLDEQSPTALRIADIVDSSGHGTPGPLRAVAAQAAEPLLSTASVIGSSPAGGKTPLDFERALQASRRAAELLAAEVDVADRDDGDVAVRSTREDGSYSKQTTKALLIQQYDHELRDCIAVLRDENSKLIVEIIELQRTIALNDEQMAALKDNVKELQLALTREKEFNASGHQINIEYLVNVLRKFFMTENKSERARLVIAVTQILHLRPEECKVIAEKWAVKKGGLVGWFSGTTDVGGDEGVPYDAFSDGVAGLNMYA